MRPATVLKIVAVALVMVAVALVAASKALDSGRYQAFLADRVRAASGLELSFSGPTKIKLGLSPQVSFTGLALAAKPGAPALLYIDRIEAKVALLPLVFRIIQVERVALYRPTYKMGPLPRRIGAVDLVEGGAKVPPTTFSVAEVTVEDGVVLWRSAATGSDMSLSVGRARFQPESAAGGSLNAQVSGRYRGTDFRAEGVIGPVSALLSGKSYPIQLKGSANGGVVVVRGHVAEPLQAAGLDLDIRAQGDELGELLRQLGLFPADRLGPAIGPYKMAAKLSDNSLAEVDAVFGKRDGVLVSLKGAVHSLSPLAGVDMAVSAEADGLGGLARLIAVELPSAGPLKLSGRLADIDDGWRLTGIKSSLGHSDFAGELALVHGSRPRMFGRLSSAAFHPGDFSLPQGRGAETSRATPQRPAIPVHDDRILSLDPVALEGLKAFDLNLSLAAVRLHLGAAVLADASAEISLAGGRLVVEGFQAKMGEGGLKGEFRLDASGKTPLISARLVGSGLDLSKAGGEMPLAEGRGDISLDLKAVGNSPRALAGSLEGGLQLGLSEVRLGDGVGRKLVGALDPALPAGEAAWLRCGSLRLAARSGLLSVDRGLAVETPRMAVTGGGGIDLRTEALDLAFVARGGGWVRLRGLLGTPVLVTDGPAPRLAAAAAACRPAAKAKR